MRKLREDVEAEMNHLLEIGGKAYPTKPLHDEEAFGERIKSLEKLIDNNIKMEERLYTVLPFFISF